MSKIDIEFKELKKFRNSSSAMAGLIIGLTSALLLIGADLVKENKTILTIAGYIEFGVVCAGLYYFTRKYVIKRGEFGVTFSHALGFQMLIALYASLLIGIASYVVMFVMSPEHYIALYKEIFKDNEDTFNTFKEMYIKLKDLPVLVIMYSMITTIIKWFFPAMMISAMLRNSKDPMQGFRKYMNENQ